VRRKSHINHGKRIATPRRELKMRAYASGCVIRVPRLAPQLLKECTEAVATVTASNRAGPATFWSR
jgi:hypothetical protein